MPRLGTEVIIGTGTLYHAPLGTVFPADPSVTPAAAWIEIGYSDEGWEFVVDRNFEDVMVAEEFEAIKILQTSREVHVRGALAQATIDTIQLAMGGGTIVTAAGPPATKTYTPPGPSAAPTNKALLLRVNTIEVAGVVKVRDYQFPSGLNVAAMEVAHRKAPDKAIVATDWRMVKVTGSDVFTIKELT